MNHWKKLLIPGLLLLILAVVLVLTSVLGDRGSSPTTATTEPIQYLFYSAEADLATITLENESGKMVVVREESQDAAGNTTATWQVRTPANPAYADASVKNMVSSLRALASMRLIRDDATDLSLYGLDQPAGRAILEDNDGNKTTILIGDMAGSGANYYATVAGSGVVHLIGTGTGDAVLRPAMSYLDSQLCSAAYEDIKTVAIRRRTDQLHAIFHSQPFYNEMGELVELQWKFETPLHWMGETLKVEPLVNEIIAATATEFVAAEVAATDLAQFGLDVPLYEFEISDANQTYTITLGKAAGSGMYYGSASRIPGAVFVVAASKFTLVDAPVMQWLNRFVFLANIADTVGVDLLLDGTRVAMEIDGKAEPNVFKIDGKDANIVDSSGKSYFKSFYQSIIGATLVGIDREAQPDLTQAIVEIRYTFRDGGSVQIAYVPRDAYTLYAFLDGEYTGGYVDIDTLDKQDFDVGNALPAGLRPAYQGMVDAMRKAEGGIFN